MSSTLSLGRVPSGPLRTYPPYTQNNAVARGIVSQGRRDFNASDAKIGFLEGGFALGMDVVRSESLERHGGLTTSQDSRNNASTYGEEGSAIMLEDLSMYGVWNTEIGMEYITDPELSPEHGPAALLGSPTTPSGNFRQYFSHFFDGPLNNPPASYGDSASGRDNAAFNPEVIYGPASSEMAFAEQLKSAITSETQ
jgi:hypothetical protein